MQKYWILVGSDCRKEEVGGATLTPIYTELMGTYLQLHHLT